MYLPDARRVEARPEKEAVDVGGQDEEGLLAVGVATVVTEVRTFRWHQILLSRVDTLVGG